MKKRCLKKVASLTIALALVLGLFALPEINSYAVEEHPTGLKDLEVDVKEVSEEEFDEIVEESQKADVVTFIEKSYKATDAFWYQFSSPYYNYSFSRLNANQRKLYDDLYSKLMTYVDGGADFTYDSTHGLYLTPIVKYTGLTQEEALNVAYLLIYDTPELYYLSQYIGIYINSYGQTAVRIGVYDDMRTGASRANYASQIKSKINWYLSQVSTSASAYDKEKKIHDLLCDNCYYGSFNTPYDQSCASVFLNPGGETVCAGYSEAFALLCYARGIPVMSITSETHEWNQVKLGNYWYAVDVTWDDSGSSRYKHFNKSDNTMLALGRVDHTLEGFWGSVGRENCPYDWGNEPSGTVKTIYRLYNPNSGEHFYTLNYLEEEYLSSIGWRYEGIGWYTPYVSNTPVYRMYNPNAGDHHYTMNYNEVTWLVSLGWNYEGISWYSDDNRSTVLYRLYNPNAYSGAHHYTMNSVERDVLVNVGWNYEGIAWYGL